MKDYVYTIFFGIIVFFIGMCSYQKNELVKYKKLYSKELQNVEAYRLANSDTENNIRQYQMTVDDLKASKDSIDRKLIKVIDELKIKDKKIDYLQYHSTATYKTDTIQIPDTIFLSEVNIDTIIKDDWYKLELGLHYPSKITVSPTFNSEKYIIVNTKKEYNNTPSKLFFIRWFQKKHQVIEVNIEEKSPYIINKQNKFIKIVK